jgi:hypothetical protein
MKNILLRKTFSVLVSAVIAALSLGSAFGQAVKLIAEKPTFDDLQSPEYSGGGKQKPFKPKNWLEIEAKLNIAGGATSKAKVCDRLTVKWYVLVKNPDKAASFLLLTKDVEHVNIPYDEDVYCSVYLSPVSVKRLTGSDRPGKGSVEAVGYEVLVNGVKVAAEAVGRFKVGFWNEASDKVSRNDSVPLLNKAETPFRAMWWDRYAEVSEGRGSR